MKWLYLLLAGLVPAALACYFLNTAEKPVEDSAEELPEPVERQVTLEENVRAFNAGAGTFYSVLRFSDEAGGQLLFPVQGDSFRALQAGTAGILSWVPSCGKRKALFLSFVTEDGTLYAERFSAKADS